MPAPTYFTVKLQQFYGQPVLYLPSHRLPSPNRVFLAGTLNMHAFEAIAEPWRDGQHLLVIPAHLLKQLWIDEDAEVNLMFTASADIPRPKLPQRLQKIFKENPDYARAFDGMAQSDQMQYLAWIAAAPSPHETEVRIERIIRHVRDLLKLGEEFHLMYDPHGYLA